MDESGKEKKKYKVSLTVFYGETGVRKPVTLAEAKTWDWENPEKVRSIGPWHIYSYARLLAVLADKAQAGCEEIEIDETPFFMSC
jgi:hypothetical protein